MSLQKVKKLLMCQRCTGSTLSEEYNCFKKAIEIVLRENIEEVDLDLLLRHLYKLNLELNVNKNLDRRICLCD